MEHAVGRQGSESLFYRGTTELQDVVRFLILCFLTGLPTLHRLKCRNDEALHTFGFNWVGRACFSLKLKSWIYAPEVKDFCLICWINKCVLTSKRQKITSF